MYVRNISLVSWRNVAMTSADFERGVNVLWGMNAQGKSNILESIYYFARGRSFRGGRDTEISVSERTMLPRLSHTGATATKTIPCSTA